jgi:hypothetical protein
MRHSQRSAKSGGPAGMSWATYPMLRHHLGGFAFTNNRHCLLSIVSACRLPSILFSSQLQYGPNRLSHD